MQVKPYAISTVVGLLAASGMGVIASTSTLQPVAKNNARTEALEQVVNYLNAKNCFSVKAEEMPEIGEPISSKRQISTACLYYPKHQRFAFIGRLNNQLQIIYLYTNTEVRKANGSR